MLHDISFSVRSGKHVGIGDLFSFGFASWVGDWIVVYEIANSRTYLCRCLLYGSSRSRGYGCSSGGHRDFLDVKSGLGT